MHCALQKKRDTAFCTSHCSPACRPYKSAVLMWCLCLSSTSWCALVQEHQRWDYTVGKGEASGFSAPSSLALPPASPNSSSFPDHRTNSACVACVLQCNSYEARLLWFLISAFSRMKPFLPFVNRFLKERQKNPTNQIKKKSQKKNPKHQANANTKPMGVVGRK